MEEGEGKRGMSDFCSFGEEGEEKRERRKRKREKLKNKMGRKIKTSLYSGRHLSFKKSTEQPSSCTFPQNKFNIFFNNAPDMSRGERL